jgi:hypothetical protein
MNANEEIQNKIDEAYNLGYDAGWDGAKEIANPYGCDSGTPESKAWEHGRFDGHRDNKTTKGE